MTPRSLRLRLLLAWAVFTLLLLQVAGIGLRVLFERSITRRTELELAADLRQIKRGMVVLPGGKIEIERKPTDPQFDIEFGGRYWEVSEADEVLARSASLKDEKLRLPRMSAGAMRSPLWMVGPKGQRLFSIVEEFTPNGTNRQMKIVTAVDAGEIKEDTDKFSSDLFDSLTVLAGLLLAGAMIHVSIGIRPLEELRRKVVAIRDGRITHIDGQFPTEIMPLVTETNELLNAQHIDLESARKRAADLAHGLNTPLAVMAAKSRDLKREGLIETAEEIDRQIELMRRHVERELARARARGTSRAVTQLVDIAPLTDSLVSALQGLPRGQDLHWSLKMPPHLMARIDPDDFNNMLGNLLENALKWAKSNIVVSAERMNDTLSISIEDDGPGIADADIHRVLQRGERADTTTKGSGLGLAIVGDLAEIYGVNFKLSRSRLGGLKAEFFLSAPEPVIR